VTSPYWAGADATAVAGVLGFNSSADADILLQMANAAATGMETWMNRVIQQHAVTGAVDGNGKSMLLWQDYPVTAVSSVSINGIAVSPATDYTGLGYRFDSTRLVLQAGQAFCRGMMNVALSYTAGFAVIPADLLQACLESAALKFRQRAQIGVSAKSLAGETITFVQADFPKSALLVMQNYKRVVPSP
jgi:hypothetical protein